MADTQEFIRVISELARYEYLTRDKWILPSVCIAQAALESGWNLEASTLFGIKGSGVTSATQEYLNGQWVTITDTFEAYPDLASSVRGYYDFLANTPRYAYALNQSDYRKAVDGLIHTVDGLAYATAPNYIECVTSIIEQYNLTIYDNRDSSATIPSNTSESASDWRIIHFYDGVDTLFDESLYGDYECIADILNVRTGAGMDNPIMVSIFEGTGVMCNGFYRIADSCKWLLIQFYGLDGSVYCGWACYGDVTEPYFVRI